MSSGAKKAEEHQPAAPVLRKSARLRQRHVTDHEDQENSNKTTGAAKIKQEPGDSPTKEERRVKVEGEKPKMDDRVVKKEAKEEEKKEGEGPEPVKEEEQRYVKSEESESGGEDDSDGSEEESDEDPDRLWCICRQPHDDRWGIVPLLMHTCS